MSSLGATLLVATLGGCPAPQSKFDEFVNRLPDSGGGHDDAAASMIYDVSGTFLLAISTTVAPDKPLLTLATNKLTVNADGTAKLDMTFQPLTVADHKLTGMPAMATVQINALGQFTADLGVQTVPGDANPVTPGSPITASLVLHGSLVSADRLCGTVTGMVTMPLPLDLAGSTWSAIRVADPMNLPPAESMCPMGASDGGVDASSPADMSAPPDMSGPVDSGAVG